MKLTHICTSIIICSTLFYSACTKNAATSQPTLKATTITFSGTAYSLQLLSFKADAAEGQQYSWSFGDGNTSTLLAPSHIYADSGTYLVSLVVNDDHTNETRKLVHIGKNLASVYTRMLGSMRHWHGLVFMDRSIISKPDSTYPLPDTTFAVTVIDDTTVNADHAYIDKIHWPGNVVYQFSLDSQVIHYHREATLEPSYHYYEYVRGDVYYYPKGDSITIIHYESRSMTDTKAIVYRSY